MKKLFPSLVHILDAYLVGMQTQKRVEWVLQKLKLFEDNMVITYILTNSAINIGGLFTILLVPYRLV